VQVHDGGATAGADRWSTKLDLPMAAVSAGTTRTSISGRVAADLVSHGDAVILDAHVPATVAYSTAGTAPASFQLGFPILAAFTDQVAPRTAGGDLLWDPERIAKVWDGFTARNATPHTLRIAGSPEVRIGNLALQQVRLFPQPLVVSTGSADSLDISAPISADLLYGNLGGTLQARIMWRDGLACATSRAAGALTGFQADALQFAFQGVTLPLISDYWDAAFAFRADDLCVNRARLKLSSDFIDHVGLRLALTRSAPAPAHGYLQLSIGTVLQPGNKILRDILRDLEMKTLPQGFRYRHLKLALETDGDRVLVRGPLLTLGGITYFMSDQVEVGGNLRLHLAPPAGDHVSVRGLLEWLRSLR
jgi:hypothetical protein